MLRLLQICGYDELANCRRLYLRSLGFDVVTATRARDAVTQLNATTSFHFVLMCFTLRPDDRLTIAAATQQPHRNVPGLIELCSYERQVTSGFAIDPGLEFFELMSAISEFNRPTANYYSHRAAPTLALGKHLLRSLQL
jgi:hypothetical protein